MTLTPTPPEIAALTAALSYWESAEYVCAGLVTVACAGEYIASFKNWFTGGIKERKERLEKRSTLLLIAALSAELVCLVRTNQLSSRVIGSLDDLAEEASTRSQEALADADTASGGAKIALNDSAAAKESATKAETLAHGARREADSFENDIVLAKNQAASAESHLADALREAADARAALERYKAPRSLTDLQAKAIADRLKPFGAQTFSVIPYWDAPESMGIAERIADTLVGLAGWTLEQPKGFNALMGVVTGVIVNVRPEADEETRQAADMLVSALREQGIDAKLRFEGTENNPKNNKINLSVGAKQ